MRFVVWLVANVLALGAATWLLPGITLGNDGGNGLATLIVVGLIFGVITSVVKPVVQLLTLPFILLTLGLLLLVINAAMLLLTSRIADGLGLAFDVSGFWTAVGGSIVISIVTWGVGVAIGRDGRR